ncbi:ROK family transcriptional regulator [Streptomyces moderatus]|nr:ROK family transcriptional regulator [Streptomyces moderatus]
MAADSRLARRINDRMALDLIAAAGRLSRTQLREQIGLAQPSVIDLVNRLLDAELIRVAGESDERTRGPRPQLYAIAGERAYVAGVHGSTGAIHAVVGDVSGWTSPTVSIPDPRLQDDPAPQVEAAIDAAFAAAGLAKHPLTAVVIGTGGAIDLSTGDIGHAPGLRHWQAHFVAPVRERLGCPVHLEREITLAAVAEDRFGGEENPERFALLWVGDGLGISCIDQGVPFRGFWGAAGEIGYLPLPSVGPDPAPPHTFQDLAGSSAVLALAHAHGLSDPTAEGAVRTAVEQGCQPFLEELADRLALGLHAIATVIDPGNVVLSGSTAAAGGADLAERVEAALASRTWQQVQVLHAKYAHGEEAILRAALLLATEHGRDAVWGRAA